MLCATCGKPYDAHHKFCDKCGSPLIPTPTEQMHSETPRTATLHETPSANVNDARPTPLDTLDSQGELKGLGGWLILVGIGLCASLAYLSRGIFNEVRLFNDGTAQLLSNPSSSVHIASYSTILRFELAGHILILVADAYLLFLFFTKSRLFPRCYIALLFANFVFVTLDHVFFQSALASASTRLAKTVAETTSAPNCRIARAFLLFVVWSSYTIRSKRVKATFVE